MRLVASIEVIEEIYQTDITHTGFKIDLDVLTRIGRAFYENRTLKKTHLFAISRTNWHAFDKYLNWLTSKNFINCKINKKETIYQLTDSGGELFAALLNFQKLAAKNT